ncbi:MULTISPECIES: SGNH/GDSL hydrolase family protein [Ramlibacter]|uniref:Phospholipase n=1 Tax=Ramlibacter pinisoli TaxID=2682844 RepID=A0A6N8ISY3_9BURK|nr:MULTISPECIES: SGNH/GDSL hydrolase family protein [Ramlibacter]MBA2964230.1 phospholipase [Ramlibacter sp. CGMCC 1.13660]MVQ29196.1 phospholipase [Ramlibacter pinisoli]
MTTSSAHRAWRTLAAVAALVLATACGGGGGVGGGVASSAPPSASGGATPASGTAPTGTATPTTPAATPAPVITRLVVAGDSLADVGTLGVKATVQNAANLAAGYPIYTDLVATGLGVGALCNYFSTTNVIDLTTHPGCTDFAVAASRVINPVTRGGTALPLSLQNQLETAVGANGGAWAAGDLIVVDAGANDAADLADAYLNARDGGLDDQAVFVALLSQQLSASAIDAALAQPDGGSVAAGLYMRRLAQTYWETIKANTLDKGAAHVAVLNVPDISLTPRLRTNATELAAAEGPAVADAFTAALRQWITGFNTELSRLAADDTRVALVPYFDDFTAQEANPAAFGLTNVTDPACPPVGEFPQACTDAALDAAPPQPDLAPGWWHTWAFADGFHPTPRGHELLAASVNRALEQAGWR